MKSRRLFLLILTIPLIIILCLISPITGQTARDIAKKAFPSVVMLLMEDSDGQPLSLGSGFLVKDGVVATNLHVVAGSVKGYAKFIGQKKKYDILGYVAIDEKSDMVLLKIKDANAPVLSLGDSSKVAIGDEIFVIGNPQGLEGTFSKGIVSAIRTIGQDSVLQITAPISPGSSGGPVLNEEGKIIGVAVATFKGGQNLNFAIPVSYLSRLSSDLQAVKKLTVKEKSNTKVKSIIDDLGGESTGGILAGKFMWSERWPTTFYSFSIHNKLRQPVKNVYLLVIFYDMYGEPLDFDVVRHSEVIPAGLAKRVNGSVHISIQSLTTRKGEAIPHTRLEFRILDFQIIEESEGNI